MKKIVAATLLFWALVTFSACGNTSGEKSSVSDISYFSSSNIESSQTEPLNSEVSNFSENSDLSDTSPLKNDEFSDEKIQTSIVSDDISVKLSIIVDTKKTNFLKAKQRWINPDRIAYVSA